MKKTKPGTSKPKMETDSAETIIDINAIIQIPYNSMMSGSIDTLNLNQIYETIRHIENVTVQNSKLISPNFHKLLSFCMNLLELEPQGTEGIISSPSDPSSALNAIKFQLKLSSIEVVCLKKKVLNLLTSLMKATKKSRLFSFWFAFLPACERLSPYKYGIFHLLQDKDESISHSCFLVLQTFFEGSSSFLQLANAHCRITSFTPVCYEFAEALRQCMTSVLAILESPIFMDPHWANVISKTMEILLKEIPFHRLKGGLLTIVAQRVLRLSPSANPVIQIAVLQICSALLSVTPPHPEVRECFTGFFDLFMMRAFSPDLHQDNNIRYVALQVLANLVAVNVDAFLDRIDQIVSKCDAVLSEKDLSITLHLLRLIKSVAKTGSAEAMKISTTSSSKSNFLVEKLIRFWLELLRPNFLNGLDSRDSAVVRAAFCDCLSDIGDNVLSQLPTEKRNLCVTYILRQCRDPDQRVVASAFRGIGMLVILPTFQADAAFLTDCADILLEAFLSNNQRVHRNVALSGTWAIANLADTLAKQHSSLPLSDCSDVDEDPVEFPPHLLLQLVRVALTHASPEGQGHMNTRASCIRALGSLIRCFDSMASRGFASGGSDGLKFAIASQKELQDLCQQVIDTLVRTIQSDKVMKVRWNACYAAGGLLKTSILYASDTSGQRLRLIDALLPLVEKFPNFKVRINAALALKCIDRRSVMANRYLDCCLTVARALDTIHLMEGDEEEVQHKNNLIDQLCLTFCHLLSLAESPDLTQLNQMVAAFADNLRETMTTVVLRISPEKASAFIDTKRWLTEAQSSGKNETLIAIFSGVDNYICC